MRGWMVYVSGDLTDEQKSYLFPPAHSEKTSVVIVAKQIDDDNFDSIIIGENSEHNRIQAEVICAALNADSRTK